MREGVATSVDGLSFQDDAVVGWESGKERKGISGEVLGDGGCAPLAGRGVFIALTSRNGGNPSSGTRNDARRLQVAVEGFHREYGSFPGMEASHLLLEGPRAGDLLKVLLGKEEEGAVMRNPRSLAFLDAKSVRDKAKGGLVFSSSSGTALPEGFYDGWGEPMEIFLRGPSAPNLVFHDGKRLVRLEGAVAAVMSKGPDRKRGTDDDMKSWD